MTLEKRIYDGNRAKEVLENEVFQQVWTDIEEELTQAWKTSPQRDEEGRQRLFVAITMLAKVKSAIEATMESGKLALADLDYQQKKSLAQRLGLGSLMS